MSVTLTRDSLTYTWTRRDPRLCSQHAPASHQRRVQSVPFWSLLADMRMLDSIVNCDAVVPAWEQIAQIFSESPLRHQSTVNVRSDSESEQNCTVFRIFAHRYCLEAPPDEWWLLLLRSTAKSALSLIDRGNCACGVRSPKDSVNPADYHSGR